MKHRLPHIVDVAAIYAVVGLLGFAAFDFITIDQSKRVCGLAMLMGVLFILGARMLIRQQRQIDGLRGRLPGQKDVAKAPAPLAARGKADESQERPVKVVELVRRH